MEEKEKITMSKKQLRQAHVLRSYNEKLINRKSAAEALGLSERQITRLAKGVKEESEHALIHKNTGRKPAHTMSKDKQAAILEIRKREAYRESNISHFMELLERKHEIRISYDALYKLLKKEGITSPKKHKKTVKHRRRKRKASQGELLQIDATPYDWFNDGKLIALHGAIDDATGMLTGLYLTENECLQGYFEVMRHTFLEYGIPLSVYSDKHTIFRSPLTAKKEEKGEEANLTQFGRALYELGINIIHAHSPQAKGRIERVWETLQSRLPVEFKIRGIKTLEEANAFLAGEYISLFNERFAVTAEDEPIFIPYTHKEDIDTILCIKETRKTDNAGSFSFRNETFKVLDEGHPLIPAKASIEVLVSVRSAIRVRYKGRIFETVAFIKTEKPKAAAKTKKFDITAHVKPHLAHGSDEWKKIWHHESYTESLTFLYELFFKPCA